MTRQYRPEQMEFREGPLLGIRINPGRGTTFRKFSGAFVRSSRSGIPDQNSDAWVTSARVKTLLSP